MREVFGKDLMSCLEKKSQKQNQLGELEKLCRQSQGQSGATEQRGQRRFGNYCENRVE